MRPAARLLSHSSPLLPPSRAAPEFLPLPRLSPLERQNFEAMQGELRESIDKGVAFVAGGK